MSLAAIVRSAMSAVPSDMKATVKYRDPGSQKVVSTCTAVQEEGDLEQYAALSLVAERTVTLFSVPQAGCSLPPIDAEVKWSGEKFVVKSIGAVAPGGIAAGASVVVTR